MPTGSAGLHGSCREGDENDETTNHLASWSSIMHSVMLLAVGDISLQTSDEIPPFETIKSAFERKDVLFGNLETTLTSGGNPAEKAAVLNISPDKAQHLKNAGFDILNVANNHIMDMGYEGLHDTLKTLGELGLPFIGVRTIDFSQPWEVIERNGLRLGFLSYFTGGKSFPEEGIYVNKIDLPTILKDIEALKSKCDLIIVSLHWGIEKVFYPSPKQIDLARTLIDAGATVVLGHHPHAIQGVEPYKTGLIAYSLGNFQFEFDPHECSNGRNKRTNQSFILAIELCDNGVRSYDIVPVEITSEWVPYVPKKEKQEEILAFISRVSEPLHCGTVTESWWLEQIAAVHLTENIKAFVYRIKRYGIVHLLQCILWLFSPFCIKLYLALARRIFKGVMKKP